MRAFPGFDHIYEFFDPFLKTVLRADVHLEGDYLAITRGLQKVDQPVIATWAMGGARPSDVIWSTLHDPLLLHEKILNVLEQMGATGWSTYPAVVKDKHGVTYSDYHGLVVTGRCGERDLSASRIELKEFPGGWFPYFTGVYFDESTWDGSDLFMEHRPDSGGGSAAKFMTEPVVEALQKVRIKNMDFTRLTEISINTDVWDGGGAARLLPPDFRERVHAQYDRLGVPRPRKWQR